MVKIREPASLDTAALAEKFGNAANPKQKRTKPYKAINIPFTQEAHDRLLKAAAKADRSPTDFIKKAIRDAVDSQLRKRE